MCGWSGDSVNNVNGTMHVEALPLSHNSILNHKHSNFTLEADIMMGTVENGSFVMKFVYHSGGWVSTSHIITFQYSKSEQLLEALEFMGGGLHSLGKVHIVLDSNRWYRFAAVQQGNRVSLSINGSELVVQTRFLSAWYYPMLGALARADVFFDNIIINTSNPSGWARTQPFQLPFNRQWDRIDILKSEPGGSSVQFNVVDGSYDYYFTNLKDIKDNITDISTITPWKHDTIRLEFFLKGKDGRVPVVDWFKVYWKPDPPRQVQDFPVIHFPEDEPEWKLLDLLDYFDDYYSPKEHLKFRVSKYSPSTVLVFDTEGSWLCIDRLVDFSWSGTLTVVVTCSDGVFTTLSEPITVVIDPVDDPPRLREIPKQSATEGAVTPIDLRPYIMDIDTPLDDIVLACDDPYVVSIVGHTLSFFHNASVSPRTVNFTVFDGTTIVNGSFKLSVISVNDPPVILGIGPYPPDEYLIIDVPEGTELFLPIRAVDEDGDTLYYSAQSDAVGVAILPNGTIKVVTIKGRPGYIHTTVKVEDGNSSVAKTSLTFRVGNVNDPPTISRIVEPQDGSTIEEGEKPRLEAEYDDLDLQLGQMLEIVWTSNISGELLRFRSDRPAFIPRTDLAPGQHKITVTVSDGELSTNASTVLTVLPLPSPNNNGDVEPAPSRPLEWSIITILVVGLLITNLLLMRARSKKTN
jgi:hypothetical protein